MAVTLTTTQQVSGQVKPVDRNGKPAQVQDGSVAYEVANAEGEEPIILVEEDPNDETKFTVKALRPGVAQLKVSADADLGEGVETIETFAAVEVIPEKAVGFGVEFGTPEDQSPGTEG